jgi:folate-dependent tRNA-U54 methylase TrmFO/GidA
LVPIGSDKEIALAFAGILIEVRGFWDCAAVGLLQTAFTSAVAAVENEVGVVVLFTAVSISLYWVVASSNKSITSAFAGIFIEVRGF